MTSPASVACDVMSRLSGLLTLIGTLSPSNVPDYVGPEDRPIVQTVIGNNDDDSDSGTHPFLGGMPIAQPPPLPLKTPKHGRKVSIVVPPVVSQPPEQQYDAVVMTAISKYYRFIHGTPIPANMPIDPFLGGMPIAQPPPLPLKTPKHGRKVSIVVPPVVSQPPEQQYDAVVMTAISKYYRFIHRTPIPANMPIGEQLCLYNTLGQVFLNQFSVKRVSALTQPAKM